MPIFLVYPVYQNYQCKKIYSLVDFGNETPTHIGATHAIPKFHPKFQNRIPKELNQNFDIPGISCYFFKVKIANIKSYAYSYSRNSTYAYDITWKIYLSHAFWSISKYPPWLVFSIKWEIFSRYNNNFCLFFLLFLACSLDDSNLS